MTSIPIDEETLKALESNARARGLPLPTYLRLLAQIDAPLVETPEPDQAELHRRLLATIAEAEKIVPEPTTLKPEAAALAAHARRKHFRTAGEP